MSMNDNNIALFDSSDGLTPWQIRKLNYNFSSLQRLANGQSATINDNQSNVHSLPRGGTAGQFLRKASASDWDAYWSDALLLPPGGAAGQVLAKNSSTDGDASWVTQIPVATVWGFAGSAAPDGWLICDGSAKSRSVYAALFAVIGTAFGPGNGTTTFNIPDFRDKVLVGASGTMVLGSSGGSKVVTLEEKHIPPHTHEKKTLTGSFLTTPNVTRNIAQSVFDGAKFSGIASGWTVSRKIALASGWESDPRNLIEGVNLDASHEHSSFGGGEAHDNMQPYTVGNYIIKY